MAAASAAAAFRLQANPLVFLDIVLGRYGDATPLGRVVVELKADVVPKTGTLPQRGRVL